MPWPRLSIEDLEAGVMRFCGVGLFWLFPGALLWTHWSQSKGELDAASWYICTVCAYAIGVLAIGTFSMLVLRRLMESGPACFRRKMGLLVPMVWLANPVAILGVGAVTGHQFLKEMCCVPFLVLLIIACSSRKLFDCTRRYRLQARGVNNPNQVGLCVLTRIVFFVVPLVILNIQIALYGAAADAPKEWFVLQKMNGLGLFLSSLILTKFVAMVFAMGHGIEQPCSVFRAGRIAFFVILLSADWVCLTVLIKKEEDDHDHNNVDPGTYDVRRITLVILSFLMGCDLLLLSTTATGRKFPQFLAALIGMRGRGRGWNPGMDGPEERPDPNTQFLLTPEPFSRELHNLDARRKKKEEQKKLGGAANRKKPAEVHPEEDADDVALDVAAPAASSEDDDGATDVVGPPRSGGRSGGDEARELDDPVGGCMEDDNASILSEATTSTVSTRAPSDLVVTVNMDQSSSQPVHVQRPLTGTSSSSSSTARRSPSSARGARPAETGVSDRPQTEEGETGAAGAAPPGSIMDYLTSTFERTFQFSHQDEAEAATASTRRNRGRRRGRAEGEQAESNVSPNARRQRLLLGVEVGEGEEQASARPNAGGAARVVSASPSPSNKATDPRKEPLLGTRSAERQSSATSLSGSDSAPSCTICLTEFEEGELVRTMPECDHIYHAACLERWARSQGSSCLCPMCRRPAYTDQGKTTDCLAYIEAQEVQEAVHTLEDNQGLLSRARPLASSLNVDILIAALVVRILENDIQSAAHVLLEHKSVLQRLQDSRTKVRPRTRQVLGTWADGIIEKDGCLDVSVRRGLILQLQALDGLDEEFLTTSWEDLTDPQRTRTYSLLLGDTIDRLNSDAA
ncbi:unnamed protein product [Amoebophrya sp. A120]|nr:unnamed protein product [Amoebophrya sp. A120]|eukprot:GSA120T00002529001.1